MIYLAQKKIQGQKSCMVVFSWHLLDLFVFKNLLFL
jgi:hypothetical protein